MAMNTAVNTQITDSISQTGVITIGSSPSVALGMLYQAVAQAMANTANSASQLQQQGSAVTMAVSGTACSMIIAQGPS